MWGSGHFSTAHQPEGPPSRPSNMLNTRSPQDPAPHPSHVLCPTLCDRAGSSVHRIFQARYWSGLP